MIAAKSTPSARVPTGYKQTEVGVIPEDWEVKALGDSLLNPPCYGLNAPTVPLNARLPTYIRITDITEDGRYSKTTAVSVDHPQADRYMLKDGDLAFARSRTPRKPGRTEQKTGQV